MTSISSRSDCNRALGKLLAATLRVEAVTAERDTEIAKIQAIYSPRLSKPTEEIAELEAAIEVFYVAHREELEVDGKKSLQLENGLIGMRAPSTPALVPLNEKWTWEKITLTVRKLWKSKYFHKPKPPIDKMKLKKLNEKSLAKCGLRLDTDEHFFYKLERPAAPDEAPAEAA